MNTKERPTSGPDFEYQVSDKVLNIKYITLHLHLCFYSMMKTLILCTQSIQFYYK